MPILAFHATINQTEKEKIVIVKMDSSMTELKFAKVALNFTKEENKVF
jgi:hypothetical protein